MNTRTAMCGTTCLRLFLLPLLVLLSPRSDARESPYFPERGGAALHQRALDMRNPAVVLSIALEPGEEDLPLLAYLRMGIGARVVSLYVTDGGSTASDLNGEPPFRVAGCRREEAYSANTLLGAETYFLNLPDMGIINTREALEEFWVPDSVVLKLGTAILSYRPDAVLIARDFRGEKGMTVRQECIERLLLKAVVSARSASPAQVASGLASWNVERVLADTGGVSGAYGMNGTLRNSVWNKSYREMGREAGRFYQSLRVRRREWEETPRSYALVAPAAGKTPPASLLAGLPPLDRRLRALASTVSRAADAAEKSGRAEGVRRVAAAIDTVEHALVYESWSLSPVGKRILATWKNGLEDLRCTLFDLRIDFSASDSLLTANQLFFLRFRSVKGEVDTGRTEIIFPGAMKHLWGINESVEYRFHFSAPQEFRVITPDKPEFNMPPSAYGIERPRPRTGFSFIIYHNDPVRAHNYAYRREIHLGMGPRRSVELLTPVVRMTNGERVLFSLMNFSRDGFSGDVSLRDSMVSSAPRHVELSRKDETLTDTLLLACSEDAPEGDHPVQFCIAGKPFAQVTARKFEAFADTSAAVGLISGIESPPVASALRGLHVPFLVVDLPGLARGGRIPFKTIVIEEEALSQRGETAGSLEPLSVWIAQGGNLVVFPQFLSPDCVVPLTGGASFRRWPALEPKDPLVTESAHAMLQAPNLLRSEDWNGWVVSRSLGSVLRGGAKDAQTVVRSSSTGENLLLCVPVGRGRVTLVGLDIDSQLRNVLPGAYRLLANLIAGGVAR